MKIIEAEIAIFAYIGVFFQDNKAPNKFPIVALIVAYVIPKTLFPVT